MESQWIGLIFWILMTLVFTLAMSFYSMSEMAIISCNKLRLEIASRRGDSSAKLLAALLQRPATLFGATLLGVNLTLILSSEAARQVFWSLGYNPNWSALFHIPYVLIIGELVPMFVARRYPDKTARVSAHFIWATSKLISPILTPLIAIFRLLFGKFFQSKEPLHLAREELFHLLEEHHAGPSEETEHRLRTLIESMISSKGQTVHSRMIPITELLSLNPYIPVQQALTQLISQGKDYFASNTSHGLIVSSIKSLTHLNKNQILDEVKIDSIVVEETQDNLDTLLKLQRMNKSYACVVDKSGSIQGIITLDALLSAVLLGNNRRIPSKPVTLLEKQIDASMLIAEFETKFNLDLPRTSAKTFQELLLRVLGRPPDKGDLIQFGPLQIQVLESNIKGAKLIHISTPRK